MQGKVVEVAKGHKVLLFDEADLQDTIKVGDLAHAASDMLLVPARLQCALHAPAP